MIRSLCGLLPAALQAASLPNLTQALPQAARAFRAVADVEINLNDRETLKKYVGVRDHLSRVPATKGQFIEALRTVLDAAKALPESSGYRKAVEATTQYRLKVCEANESDAAVEEVLDAHLEELVKECQEESKLIPLMAENRPWDISDTYSVPVLTYEDVSAAMNQPKK